MRKPNLFIVGQPKAGTTALHYFLSEHPDIYMAEVKEPHFFCKDFHEESDRYHGSRLFFSLRDEASYLKLFSKVTLEKIIGESSIHYLYSKVAAYEIYKFNPEAKIIIMLRNPAEWLYSLHNQYVNITTENEKNFSKALALETLRKQGKHLSRRVQCPSWLYYMERIKYYVQVKRFYDFFCSSKIKVIIFEDWQENNAKVYRDTLDFLEVDTNFLPHYKPVNVRAKPRLERLNYIIYNPALRRISQTVFTPEIHEFVSKKIVDRFLFKKDNKSSIEPETRDRLMRSFKSEVLKISQLIGMDLESKWGYDR